MKKKIDPFIATYAGIELVAITICIYFLTRG